MWQTAWPGGRYLAVLDKVLLDQLQGIKRRTMARCAISAKQMQAGNESSNRLKTHRLETKVKAAGTKL